MMIMMEIVGTTAFTGPELTFSRNLLLRLYQLLKY